VPVLDMGGGKFGMGVEISSPYFWGLQALESCVTIYPVPQKSGFRGPYEAHAMGGRAVAEKMTAKQRRARARKGALARIANLRRAA